MPTIVADSAGSHLPPSPMAALAPWLATAVRWTCIGYGAYLFAGQAVKLLRTQHSMGGRIEIAVWALVYLGGFMALGHFASLMIRTYFGGLAAPRGLSASAGGEIAEIHSLLRDEMLPLLQRLVMALERQQGLPQLAPLEPPAVSAKPAAESSEELRAKPAVWPKPEPAPAARAPAPTSKMPKKRELATWNTTELKALLQQRRQLGDGIGVLDVRLLLIKRLDDERARELDGVIGQWMTKQCFKAMKEGRAHTIAEWAERAIEELPAIEELRPVMDAMPTIRKCVELDRIRSGASERDDEEEA